MHAQEQGITLDEIGCYLDRDASSLCRQASQFSMKCSSSINIQDQYQMLKAKTLQLAILQA